MKTLLSNCRVVNRGVVTPAGGWVLIDGAFIADAGEGPLPAIGGDVLKIDCGGAMVMPGMIDAHVHFREPGMTHKADIASESMAAVAGGVTSYLEMPNTSPATATIESWRDKMSRAAERSVANYAFFIGATNDNMDTLATLDYRRIPGIKLFVGSSTGNLLVNDDVALERLFSNAPALIAVHAEDEATLAAARDMVVAKKGVDSLMPEDHIDMRPRQACIKASAKLAALARKYGVRLHICHLSTVDELMADGLLCGGDYKGKLVTCEVAPAHLLWCREDYSVLGNKIKINPSVKERQDRDALRRALISGKIDMVATDHAPHLLEEKTSFSPLKAVSGAPMVQFALPMLLELFDPALVVEKYAHAPASIYGVEGRGYVEKGRYVDLVIVDDRRDSPITDAEVKSLCGWTPLNGIRPSHRVLATLVNGGLAYGPQDAALLPGLEKLPKAKSMPLSFRG